MRIQKKIAIFILVLNSVLIHAQQNFPKYTFESLKNTITERAVTSISQDEAGFIWMGTNGLGLNRFNGADYISYRHKRNNPKSLSSSQVHTTYIDDRNRLWIATEAGLDLYNPKQDNFISIDLDPRAKNNSIAVHSIFQYGKSIIVGTHQHGIFKINPETKVSTALYLSGFIKIENLLINSLESFDGFLFIGTNQGLFKLSYENDIITPLTFSSSNKELKKLPSIQALKVDAHGNLWIGTRDRGLYKLKKSFTSYIVKRYPITHKRVLSLLNTPRSTLLCGTENDGIFEVNSHGEILNRYTAGKYEDSPIKSNSIWSLFLDKQNRIWVGYYNAGLGIYDKYEDKFEDITSEAYNRQSLHASSVTALLKADNKLWIGMDGGGIDVYNPQYKTFTHLLDTTNPIARGLDASDVQTLFKDSRGNIWAGTWNNGIYVLKKGSHSFINYTVQNTTGLLADRVLAIAEDSSGMIWIGTFSGGLHSYNPDNNKFVNYTQDARLPLSLAYCDISALYVDHSDNLWIGSNIGLFSLQTKLPELNIINHSKDLFKNNNLQSQNLVTTFYQDSKGKIWIGTNGSGLYSYNPDNNCFEEVSSKNGFNKTSISSILEDNTGTVWVAGNNGLSRIDENTYYTTNFTKYDGLLTNDFNNNSAYKDDQGILYFGSYRGINYFKPKQLNTNINRPNVYLSDFKLFNESVAVQASGTPLKQVISQTESIQLRYNQSVFTIDYAAINFTHPENIKFAYYLKGFEKDYNYVGSKRSATYTNLEPGNYTFFVKAANSDGFWNESPRIINIEILKPWWLSITAITSYLALLSILIYGTYSFIRTRNKRRRLLMLERERHLYEESLHTKKIQFFTNISHEFRTPLSLIISPLEELLKNKDTPAYITKKHTVIYKNADRLKRLIDELMDFRKLQFEEIPLYLSCFRIGELIQELLNYFEEEIRMRNIAVSTNCKEVSQSIWADRNKIEKVVFNLLSNAFKTTPDNGIITVNIAMNEATINSAGRVDITIEDTGSGIAPKELDKIFNRFYQIKERSNQYYNGTGIGLELVKNFVELHKGNITVDSTLDVGTIFQVSLPIEKIHYKNLNNVFFEENMKQNKSIPPPFIEIAPKKNRANYTLLIVEDHTELRNYLTETLGATYTIMKAANGQEGFEEALHRMPDVIITDVIMPIMDGHKLCSKLKNDLRTSHIPVLMLSAKNTESDWISGLGHGADAYADKPFNINIIQAQLEQLIKNRKLLFRKYLNQNESKTFTESAEDLDEKFVLKVIAHILENLNETTLNVEQLASMFNLSRSQFYRKIKAISGFTANQFIRKVRLDRAMEMLKEGTLSVSEISYKVGFSSPSYFSKCFKEHFEILPTEVEKKSS